MQNFNSNNKRANTHSPPSAGQQDFQKIFHRLKQLHQIQDESRNELCPVFLDEESLIKSRRQSNWSSQHPLHQPNILKQLQETAQPATQDYLSRDKPKKDKYNHQYDQDLRQSNRKLMEDNQKLFNQCIRLKKICKTYESKDSFKKKQTHQAFSSLEPQLERQNKELRTQVQNLRFDNQSLQKRLKIIQQQINSQQIVYSKYEEVRTQLQQATRLNSELSIKVNDLERELQAANARSTSKSSQSISINNSTQQSRKTDVEKDRMVINMKIVHESQKLKLKNIIQQLKKQLSKNSQQSSFSNLVNIRRN